MARTVLTGGLVKVGINLGTSVAVHFVADTIAPEKAIFKIVKGKYKINYENYAS